MRSLLVSNTGPLIALGLVDRLDLLRQIASRIMVPPAVREEVLAGGDSGAGVEAFRAAWWIEVGEAAPGSDPILAHLVGAGEAEVIQMARTSRADAVLIDDAKARRVARDAYGLTVMGTVRVLLESRRAGLVDRVGPILAQMRAAGYWIAETIVARALLEADEH